VIFTVFSQNPLPAALLTYLAEIPLRLAAVRENPYALLTDWVPDAEPFAPLAHEVTRQVNLVRAVGAQGEEGPLSLAVPQDDAERAVEKLRAAGIDPRAPWVILHPGASEAKRRYPAAQYIEAGRALRAEGVRLVVTGVEAERALASEVAHGIGCPTLAGQLSLGEFIGLVDRAALLIANNTGPVHIAAAVGTPVVVLYARTNPQHTPWRVPSRVLYFDVPPDQRSRNVLLQQIDPQIPQPARDAAPEDIVAAARDLLSLETRLPASEEQA
jgi:ADP-heptose:LPS heptosyltransferase